MNLKPCPFCGSSANFVSKSETYGHGDFGVEWFVSCVAKSCGGRMPSATPYSRPSEEEQKSSAAAAWNKRCSEAEGRWVNVKERQPENGSIVICYWPADKPHNLDQCIGDSEYCDGRWYRPDNDEDDYREPSHWMPMPSAPGVK